MEALLVALLPVLYGEATIGAALGSISLATWIEIAAGLIAAEPTFVKLLSGLHPVFDNIAKDLKAGMNRPEIVGALANSWMERNGQAAIAVQDSMD